jgi:glycosyltransferase involved in cell wall biosynthesis
VKLRVIILGDAISNHVIKWARGVSAYGHMVKVISCGGRAIDGIDSVILGRRMGGPAGFLRQLAAALREIRRFKPNLIHAFQTTGYGLWGAKSQTAVPKVLTPLGSDIASCAHRGVVYRSYLRYVLKRFDYFTTPSRFLKEVLMSFNAVKDERVSVIPFGVEIPERFREARFNDPVRIVYMKHLLPVYGPHILLKALAVIREKGLPIKLDMFGHDYESGWIRKLADELSVSGMVEFMGWIEMDLVLERLLEYDFMVMPSLSESFGVAALDAAAVGLPVIASNVGGIPEIIKDGETGMLVPPNNPRGLAEAIMKMATDVELRKRMGTAARKRAAELFAWSDNLRAMMSLYDRAVAGKEHA